MTNKLFNCDSQEDASMLLDVEECVAFHMNNWIRPQIFTMSQWLEKKTAQKNVKKVDLIINTVLS